MANSINWFEIPSKNFDRACKFYSSILGGEVHVAEMGGDMKMGMLPNFSQGGGVGGHISSSPDSKPSNEGVMVYLNGGDDLQVILDKVEPAGGKVVMPKTKSPGGYMAIFTDTEGNRMALHNA
ncbi:VOC family protein [Fulvivirgaceae bacterium BMA12]|uniref:VOC family protein n=1 Tax=Agaribacillus aureus TaxID=3051825 RepID=A0ABT8LAA5_9BACT|nr:VOC family protein [Fulvivirgaceae bacterium BMA12]